MHAKSKVHTKLYGKIAIFFQVIVAVIKSLIIVNKNLFDGLSTLVIASLLGIASDLNPNETIRITSLESSWLGE